MKKTALLLKPCGIVSEINLKKNLEDNFETNDYKDELRLLYIWRLGEKIVEMYGYIDGPFRRNKEELPNHKHKYSKYYGDILLLSKDMNGKNVSFTWYDFLALFDL